MVTDVEYHDIGSIIDGVESGYNVVKEGLYVVAHTGGTTYVAFDLLSVDELRTLASYKAELKGRQR